MDIFDKITNEPQNKKSVDVFDSLSPSAPRGKVAEQDWSDLPGNIKTSAVEYVKNLGSAVANPVQTLTSIYQLVKGSGAAMPGGFAMIPRTQEDRQAFVGFTKAMADRYGSPAAMKQTMINDPVGFLSDAAGAVSLTGGAVRGLATTPRMAKVGGAIAKTAEMAEPLNIAKQSLAAPARAVGATGLPQRMYTGVVKPTKNIDRAERAAMFELATREGIIPKEGGRSGILGRSYGGLETVGEIKAGKGAQIEKAIADAEASGEKVFRDTALSEAMPTVEKQWSRPQRAQSVRQVKEYMEDYPETMTPMEAQRTKVDIGQELRDTEYGKQSLGRKAVQKDFRRGLRQELERIHPELKTLNADYAEIRNLESAIDDAIKRIQNRQLIGLTDTAGMAANPVFAIKAALGIPQVKSRLAIALARARKLPNYGSRGPATKALLQNVQRENEYGGR